MNVFSTLQFPKAHILLTEDNYNSKTHRKAPYVVIDGVDIKSYALCPACQNPVILVNRNVRKTGAMILYAKHAGYSVPNLATHSNQKYQDCPFHNPERFDSKTVRQSSNYSSQVREALLHHTHLVVSTIEKSTGIVLSDRLVEKMLMDFKAGQGHKYKSVTIYNLPFAFAYLTESKDLVGVKVSDPIMNAINAKSKFFEVDDANKVRRSVGGRSMDLVFYFNNHRLSSEERGSDSVDLVIAEVGVNSKSSTVLYRDTLEFDSAFFFNTYMRRERLRLLALKHL